MSQDQLEELRNRINDTPTNADGRRRYTAPLKRDLVAYARAPTRYRTQVSSENPASSRALRLELLAEASNSYPFFGAAQNHEMRLSPAPPARARRAPGDTGRTRRHQLVHEESTPGRDNTGPHAPHA